MGGFPLVRFRAALHRTRRRLCACFDPWQALARYTFRGLTRVSPSARRTYWNRVVRQIAHASVTVILSVRAVLSKHPDPEHSAPSCQPSTLATSR